MNKMQGYPYIRAITLDMINYTSEYQLEFGQFNSLYQLELDPSNRWTQLGAHLPWDVLAKVYAQRASTTMGAKGIDVRVIIGSFIVKRKLGLTDEETLQTISENPYIQFFRVSIRSTANTFSARHCLWN